MRGVASFQSLTDGRCSILLVLGDFICKWFAIDIAWAALDIRVIEKRAILSPQVLMVHRIDKSATRIGGNCIADRAKIARSAVF